MNSVETAQITPGTRVFVRCDIDVPIENGQIGETYRLESILPTLLFLKEKKAKIIIAGQIGDETSTKILLPYFTEKLGEGNFELLENLRFNPGEKKNDPKFAAELASKADIYVNECFSTSHREHASFVELPKLLPSYAGFRLIKEVENLSKILDNPNKPLVAIIGGAKIESKLPVVQKFLEIADAVLLGGKVSMEWKGAVPEKLYLSKDFAKGKKDIGPKTIEGFSEIISYARTIIWAGPMGLYEEKPYDTGTRSIADAIINSKAFSVIGGGDTTAAVNKFGLLDKFGFASTGGGAMLDFLAKGTLPGLKALGYLPQS